MNTTARTGWMVGLGLLLAGGVGCKKAGEQPGAGGQVQTAAEAAQQQAQNAQAQAHAVLDQSAEAQERAAEQQREAAEAQKEVASAQQKLAEARSQAERERSEAEQALQMAQQQAGQAQRRVESLQQQAEGKQLEAQAQREAQQSERRAEQAAASDPRPAAAASGAEADVMTADGWVEEVRSRELVIERRTGPSLHVKIDSETPVIAAGGRQGSLADLQPGAAITVAYRLVDDQAVADRIEQTPSRTQGRRGGARAR